MAEPSPLTDAMKEQFKMNIADLDARLEKYDPTMGKLLHDIHAQLQSIPDLAYILSEEEVGTIVEANKKVMKIEIAANLAPKRESVKKLMDSADVSDF